MTGRKRVELLTLEVIRYLIVKPLLLRRWREVLRERDAIGKPHIFLHLPPEGPLAHRLEPVSKLGELTLFDGPAHIACPERFDVAE